MIVGFSALLRGEEEPKPDETTAASKAEELQRAAYVRTMQILAKGCKVVRVTDDGEAECKTLDDSALNWNDAARHPNLIVPGTTWIWHDNGRPQLIGEIYGRVDSVGQWAFFMCNLSADGLRFSEGPTNWKFTKSYYGPRDIADAPRVAPTKSARGFQIRDLVGRFDAHQFWEGERSELRLLPKPIHRYEDESAGILDGALYAFVHGTNPEVLILIEAHATSDAAAWKVGFGSLAGANCVVRLDGKEFWNCPRYTGDPADPRQGLHKAVPVVDLKGLESGSRNGR
jgi:hypothetical protein